MLWRGIYGELEKLIAILVCGFSFSVVVALMLLVVKPDERYPISLANVFLGCTMSLGELAPTAAAIAVVSLLGALGATASEMFMYPYWVLEKGYAENVGPADVDGWLERAHGWVASAAFGCWCGHATGDRDHGGLFPCRQCCLSVPIY